MDADRHVVDLPNDAERVKQYILDSIAATKEVENYGVWPAGHGSLAGLCASRARGLARWVRP